MDNPIFEVFYLADAQVLHYCRRQGDERDKRAAEREEEAVAGQQEHRPPKAPWRHAVQHDRNRQKGREEKGGIVRRH